MSYNQKRQKSLVKGHNYRFFSKFRAFRTLHSPKQHVFLEVLIENKSFYFSKRTLLAGATHNMWSRKALNREAFLPLLQSVIMFNFRRIMKKFCKILEFLHWSKIKTYMLVSANYKFSVKIQTARKKHLYYFAL